MKTFCYHVRDNRDKKRLGGTRHAETLQEAAKRVASDFTLTLGNSGRPQYLGKDGKEVRLYLSIIPEYTASGADRIKELHAERSRERAEVARLERVKTEKLESLLDSMTTEEAIEMLSRA